MYQTNFFRAVTGVTAYGMQVTPFVNQRTVSMHIGAVFFRVTVSLQQDGSGISIVSSKTVEVDLATARFLARVE